MRKPLFAFSFLLPVIASFGQANLSFTAYPENSPVQAEIWHLEGIECAAILKRDTVALQKIWATDFTANSALNEVITIGGKKLPNYSYISRTNKILTEINDEVVFVSGEESIIHITDESNPRLPIKRHYTHIWQKENGMWKLKNKFTSSVKN